MATPENVEPQEGQRNRHARRAAGPRLAYSLDEFADAAGISRRKLYDEIRAGRLKAKKLGSRSVILAPDAQAYLAALPDMAQAAA
jgi:hypothetical protein